MSSVCPRCGNKKGRKHKLCYTCYNKPSARFSASKSIASMCPLPKEATNYEIRQWKYRKQKKIENSKKRYKVKNKHLKGKAYKAFKSCKKDKPSHCEICNKLRPLQAHHEDYAKPFDVHWLCQKCHSKLHNRYFGKKYFFKNYKKKGVKKMKRKKKSNKKSGWTKGDPNKEMSRQLKIKYLIQLSSFHKADLKTFSDEKIDELCCEYVEWKSV